VTKRFIAVGGTVSRRRKVEGKERKWGYPLLVVEEREEVGGRGITWFTKKGS
jgi:hypothetical protein